MNVGEQIFSALTDVGTDLVDMAEHQRFDRSPWRKLASMAACLAVILGLGAALWYYLPGTPVQPVDPDPVITDDPIDNPAPGPEQAADEAVNRKELDALPFYIFASDPEDDTKPSKVLDADGQVILEVASGHVEPLVDQLTGEYVGIMVYHLAPGQTLGSAYLDEYTLDGKQVYSHLMAYAHEILGDIEIISSYADGLYSAALYGHSQKDWLRGDLLSGQVVGNCIIATPMNRTGEEIWVFDSTGKLTVFDDPAMDSYYVSGGKTYFIVADAEGRLGLTDDHGNQLVPCQYTDIYSSRNGYLRCRDKNGSYAIDEATGQVMFQWAYDILEVYDDLALVNDRSGNVLLVDRDGAAVAQGQSILALDDENDGAPEGFLIQENGRCTFLRADGSVLSSFTAQGEVEIITSRTAALMEDGQVTLLYPRTGEVRTDLGKAYTAVSPILEDNQVTGLFYAEYDGGTDLLQEDGTVVLKGILQSEDRQGDAFPCEENGVRGLRRLDGSWLCREDAK